jgi:hypothetical protein
VIEEQVFPQGFTALLRKAPPARLRYAEFRKIAPPKELVVRAKILVVSARYSSGDRRPTGKLFFAKSVQNPLAARIPSSELLR